MDNLSSLSPLVKISDKKSKERQKNNNLRPLKGTFIMHTVSVS